MRASTFDGATDHWRSMNLGERLEALNEPNLNWWWGVAIGTGSIDKGVANDVEKAVINTALVDLLETDNVGCILAVAEDENGNCIVGGIDKTRLW